MHLRAYSLYRISLIQTAAGRGTNLKKLATQPPAAKTAPSVSASAGPFAAEIPKHNATSAAPVACPVNRDDATIPLAPPLLAAGTLIISARRFGA